MLTNKEIKKQIDLGNVQIDNMLDNALDKPNSCRITLSDELYFYDYMVVDTKESYEYQEEVFKGVINKLRKTRIPKSGMLLEPHKVYLAKTNENIKTKGYIPVMHGRTSLSLLGLSIELTSGYGTDNYDGPFLLSIICTKPTIIYPNIEVGNLTFFKSLDETSQDIGMLSGDEIKKRMTTGDIVINPDNKILINPNSVNLSLNPKMGYYTDPILDIKKENKVEYFNIGEEGTILYPDKTYLGRTNEWTETNNLIPMISGRSSLGRLGYHVHCSGGMGSIGYKGYFHLGIRTTLPIRVYKDMLTCQIYYFTPEGEIENTYNGSMQNKCDDKLGSMSYKLLKK